MKDGSFRPLPVRERKIPKPGGSGKVRSLGFATLDNVVSWRLIRMLKARHQWSWKDIRRHFTSPTGR